MQQPRECGFCNSFLGRARGVLHYKVRHACAVCCTALLLNQNGYSRARDYIWSTITVS